MIWENLIANIAKGQRPRFEGLMFEFKYDETTLGAGRLLKLDGTTSNTTAAVDVVK